MEVLYVLTVILLGISFMIFKKSEEKLNFIKWIVIFIVSLLGYNVTIGMILGLLNITSYMLLLSLINIAFSVLLGYKAIKNKDFQKYEVRKIDVAGLLIVLAIFTVVVIKDIRPQDGGIKYAAIDSAVHYRAAKHYADNLKIFVNVEDKTIFNFKCLTLRNPMDCSPPGSAVRGILQARTLECVAIPFPRGFSQPRDQTRVSCIAGRFFTIQATSLWL